MVEIHEDPDLLPHRVEPVTDPEPSSLQQTIRTASVALGASCGNCHDLGVFEGLGMVFRQSVIECQRENRIQVTEICIRACRE